MNDGKAPAEDCGDCVDLVMGGGGNSGCSKQQINKNNDGNPGSNNNDSSNGNKDSNDKDKTKTTRSTWPQKGLHKVDAEGKGRNKC